MTRYFKLAAIVFYAYCGLSFVVVLVGAIFYQDAPTWAAVGALCAFLCGFVSDFIKRKGKP